MLNNRTSWPGRIPVTLMLVALVLAAIALASVFQPVLAQQEDAGQPPATETDTRQDSDKAQKDGAKSDRDSQPAPATRPAADSVFKPSEEISEDLSVPFPVDI